jgi:hypothetical protein
MSIDSSAVGDLLLRSNRAISVEPNLIAGANDMKMNNGHYRHYLCQQKSLPTHYDSTSDINHPFPLDQSVCRLMNIIRN